MLHTIGHNIYCRCIKTTMLLQKKSEYSELARNKAIKTRASWVIAIIEFYSTRSINFFQDKISIKWVELSKMPTLDTLILTLNSTGCPIIRAYVQAGVFCQNKPRKIICLLDWKLHNHGQTPMYIVHTRKDRDSCCLVSRKVRSSMVHCCAKHRV